MVQINGCEDLEAIYCKSTPDQKYEHIKPLCELRSTYTHKLGTISCSFKQFNSQNSKWIWTEHEATWHPGY